MLDRPIKSIVNPFYKLAVDELVRARNGLGWSQAELAARWKRNQSVIAKIETLERRLDLVEFIDLCVLLRLDPTDTISEIHAHIKVYRQSSSGSDKV